MTENPDKNSRIITDTPNIDNSISNNSILNPFPDILPVLPLKDIVIFPYMIFPVLEGRESTIKSINNSVESNNLIFLVSQIDSTIWDF